MESLCTSDLEAKAHAGPPEQSALPLTDERSAATSRNLELVENVERLVMEHLPRRLGETTLAKAVGISVANLHRAFLDARSSTMYQALYTLRLEAVNRILESDPTRAPAAVAFQCGFGHYGVFHRRYRRYLALREQQDRDTRDARIDTDASAAPAVRASA